jgi:hypothetical protein
LLDITTYGTDLKNYWRNRNMNTLEKTAREFASIAFDKSIEDLNSNARGVITATGEYNGFMVGAHWAIDTIFNWLKSNMDVQKSKMKDMLGKDMCLEYLTADFKSVDELIGKFKYDILVEE